MHPMVPPMPRQATDEEKRTIDPLVEGRRFFRSAEDVFLDWFISTNGILKDPWDYDRTILEQVRDRMEKAKNKLVEQMNERGARNNDKTTEAAV